MYGTLLKQFTMDTGTSQKEVAAKLHYSAQRVNNYYRDIADAPHEFLEAFKKEFNVDLKRLKEKKGKGLAAGISSTNPIPVFDMELKPVKGLDFFNKSELVSYYIDAPLYNDCSAAVRVPGNSMSPAFNQGDVVPFKRIENFDTAPLGEPYLIITDEQRLLRYLRANPIDPKKYFTLKAANPEYDDMIIKRTDIKFLLQIKGKMERY